MPLFDAPSVVVITGATGTFAAEAAKILSETMAPGSLLILASRSKERLAALPLNKDRGVETRFAEIVLAQPCKDTYTKALFEGVDASKYTNAVIVHNAGSMGDMGKQVIDMDDVGELQELLNIGVTSTIVINSLFLKKFAKAQRFVLYVTAPSATVGNPSFGHTVMVKSPIYLIFQVLSKEEPSVKVLNFDPVLCDSAGLRTIRDTAHDPHIKAWIQGAYKEGKVLPKEKVAGALVNYLQQQNYKSGDIVKSTDAGALFH